MPLPPVPGPNPPGSVSAQVGPSTPGPQVHIPGTPVSVGASSLSGLDPFSGIASILSGLTSGAFWLRVGEVLAGLVLVGIGLNSMLKGKPLELVTKAAGAVPKVVPV